MATNLVRGACGVVLSSLGNSKYKTDGLSYEDCKQSMTIAMSF